MESVWSKSIELDSFKKLDGDVKTDVLIIGGGMAGLLCAYFLEQQRIPYILVEGGKIGCGITKNTTAKITAQHGVIYNDMINNAGFQKAKQYLDVNLWGVGKFRELCKNIDCDFEEMPSFAYSLTNREMIEKEVSAVNKLGFNAEFTDSLPLPLDIAAAIKFPSQAQFNPLKFLARLSRGLNIRENTFIEKVSKNRAETKSGNITANKIIITTHFPMINIAGLYSLKLYQHRSYVIALDNAVHVGGMYVDEAQNGLSFRNYQSLLLIGGGDHRTGEEGGNWRELRDFAKTFYPNAVEKYAWATQDCMSIDSVPYIGRLTSLYPNVYVATGFNKWGMTSSMVRANILTDMIMDKNNRYAEVFNPNRSMLKKQLAVNSFEAVKNLVSFNTKRCTH
ncbi:MAG: FAD-binding oxidoreductase, partial [Clostridiaceae bacterium]|nr:FAD-binding oxidoreductase [Clostridiaceae bacterium]